MRSYLKAHWRTPLVRSLLRAAWTALLLLVVIGSLLPAASPPIVALAALRINDKVQHLLAYAGLAFLPALHERPRTVAATALGLIALGVSLEFGQRLSPGRSFELADMAADAAGVVGGALLGYLVRRLLFTPGGNAEPEGR